MLDIEFREYKWELIIETDDFVVEYDKTENTYRVSYFEDEHFVTDIKFKGVEKEKEN